VFTGRKLREWDLAEAAQVLISSESSARLTSDPEHNTNITIRDRALSSQLTSGWNQGITA